MKHKSMGINAGLNMIRTIFQVIFPLVTFPYISRVLHVNNVGIYNFCTSIISYFSLLAGLGIETYAVREGARYRDNKDIMNEFASEVFSINIVSTVISYLILFLCVACIPRLNRDSSIILVLSISIIFTTIGCQWIFTIYEDFVYITIRSIAFQIIALILMFIFVKSEDDLINYAFVTVISSTGSNIINAFSRRKYCRIRLVFNREMLKRLVPILILFANSVATTIYTSSDTTMLGIMSGDYATGLYSVSTKIYTVVKNVLAAIIIVSVPRLSAYLGEKRIDKFDETANQVLNALIVLVVPAMVGIFALSQNIVVIISGKEYVEATMSLRILAIALLFSIFSWFYTSCICIPCREEKKVLGATIIAAITNIGLNFILIPFWQQNAAAFTTVIAEFLSMIICFYYGRKYFKAKVLLRDVLSVITGCVGILVICYIADVFIKSLLLSTLTAIVGSVTAYGVMLVLMKNQSLAFIVNVIKAKIGRL